MILCIFSCKYIRLWYSELLIASKNLKQLPALSNFQFDFLVVRKMVASKNQNPAAVAAYLLNFRITRLLLANEIKDSVAATGEIEMLSFRIE